MNYKDIMFSRGRGMLKHYTNDFKRWLHENYIISNRDTQEIYNILFSNKKFRDDIRTIITYLNNYNVKSKLELHPAIIRGLGLEIIVYTPDNTPHQEIGIQQYIQNMILPFLKTKQIEFVINKVTYERYTSLRTREHYKSY